MGLPKLNLWVAIRALLTIIIPTDVTTLNIQAAASNAAFLLALLAGSIFSACLESLLHLFSEDPDHSVCIAKCMPLHQKPSA